MSALDDGTCTLPDGGGTSFTDAEWKRAMAAAKKSRDRLAKTCKHLIKSDEPPKKRKVDWNKIKEERERMEQKLRDAERQGDGYNG